MNETTAAATGREYTAQAARRRKVTRLLAALLAAGLAYYAFCRLAGFGIPCPIRAVTGWLCPGCGMTRALTALLSGDPATALRQNALSLTVLPILGVYGVWRAMRYVRDGETPFQIQEILLLTVLTMAAIAYGISRNIGRTPDPTIPGRLLNILQQSL